MTWRKVSGRFVKLVEQKMKSMGGAVGLSHSHRSQWLMHTSLLLFLTPFMAPGNLVAGTVQPDSSEPPADRVMLKGARWLASQPASNYTVQLLAGENREGIEYFAAQRRTATPLAIFSMSREGRRLYALVQGSYASRADAELAAAKLPAGIEPWVRSMKSVQNVMESRQAIAQRPVPASAATISTSIEDTAWAWSQNPRHYTVQVVSAVDEKAIEAIRLRHSLPGKMAVVQIPREDKLLYVLIYGSFPTKAAAQESLHGLPDAIQPLKPLLRNFADLQDAISHAGAFHR